ncbi:hypothetical protein AB0M02_26675 [Actinoplanes sp. NPDC051861]|uniref:DUF7779 domain-containing protein n=1 Tax=Actinoplanes sp. NPDC051861 TaxID=3155170 RepID=UPI00341759AA
MEDADPVPISVDNVNGMMIGDRNVLNNYFPGGRTKLPDRVFRVPFPIDPEFVGRDAEMAALTKALKKGSRAVVNQTISGLGGIGKTQLVAHVAHRVADRFRIVWWIESEHRTTMEASLRELGKAMELGGEPSSTEVLTSLSSLNKSIDWLLVYDNAESPESLRGMLPTRGSGHVLITTRHQDWPAWASVTNLGPLSTSAAATLLTGDSGDEAAERIAEMFGCLPLALRQAAAQLRAGMSLERYEDLLRSRFVDAIESTTALPDYRHSVVDVLLMARSAAVAVESEAERLLLMFALLDADRVEDWLLERMPSGDSLADPLVLTRAIAALMRYSLVTEVRGKSKAYAVHRVVQEVIRQAADEDAVSAAARVCVVMLTDAVAPISMLEEQRLNRVAEHLKRFLDVAERHCERETVQLFRALAHRSRASMITKETAVWAARQALRIAETGTSFTDDEIVAALMQVHHVEADQTFFRHREKDTTSIRRALALRREKEPGGSPAVAGIQLELARTLAGQMSWWVSFDFADEDLTEAESLAGSAIAMLDALDHRDTIASARVLRAGIAGHLGRVDSAVAEHRDAVAMAEADGTLWPGRVNVAYALLKFGRLADAREMVQPWFDRVDDPPEGVAASWHLTTIYQVYSACLREQHDWPAYLRYAEKEREKPAEYFFSRGDGPNLIHEYYSLRNVRTGYAGLELHDKVSEVDDLLTRTSLLNITGSVPRRSLRLPRIWGIIGRLRRSRGRSSILNTDWLYQLDLLADRPRTRLHLARAERIKREREDRARKREFPVRDAESRHDSSQALVVYALIREANELAALDWRAAVTTFERAQALIDGGRTSIGPDTLARACLGMVSKARPQSLPFLARAIDLLTTHSDRTTGHSVGSSCTVPPLLSYAAGLCADMSEYSAQSAHLELTAATVEERVHGRIYPAVAEHLHNAAWYARRSGTDLPDSVTPAVLLEEVLEIATVCLGDSTPRWAEYAVELAYAINDTDPARARSLLERSLEIFTGVFGPDHSSTREAAAALKAR